MDMEDTNIGYTYADLWRSHVERLNSSQKSTQEIRNHLSAFNLFRGAAGRSYSDSCGMDFTENFELKISRLIDLLRAKNLAQTTIANRISYLRAIRETYRQMMVNITPQVNFCDALNIIFQTNNISSNEIAIDVGVAKETIDSWLAGYLPNPTSFKYINKIEELFTLPKNSLVEKIKICKPLPQINHTITSLESRIKRRKNAGDQYFYKEPNDQVKSEWEELLRFYTSPFLLNGLERNTTWRVKDASRVTTRTHLKNKY